MTIEIIAAGYIVQDRDGYAIWGGGHSEAEARAEALENVGPWEDRDGNTVGPDHPEFGFDAKFLVLPATAALIEQVDAEGGSIAWDVIDGVACKCGEGDSDD